MGEGIKIWWGRVFPGGEGVGCVFPGGAGVGARGRVSKFPTCS